MMGQHTCTVTASRAPRRTTRYAITAPILFRASDGAWHEGTTVNIASLGLLFRTAGAAPDVSTPVNVRVVLCADNAQTCSLVSCVGRVVRVERSEVSAESRVAVTIDRYEMSPTPRPSSRSSPSQH